MQVPKCAHSYVTASTFSIDVLTSSRPLTSSTVNAKKPRSDGLFIFTYENPGVADTGHPFHDQCSQAAQRRART